MLQMPQPDHRRRVFEQRQDLLLPNMRQGRNLPL